MAVQPIDLQTLFAQLHKVGKLQSDLKEGAQLQQSLQAGTIQKKTEERVKSVNEIHEAGEGVERIKDKDTHKGDGGEERKRHGGHETSGDTKIPEVVRDPALGMNIDVSG